MADNEILSYDHYAEIEREGFPMPYVVEAQRGNQHILFYGSTHTNNPDDPQFSDLETRWEQFISLVEKPIVFVEGHFDQVSENETRDRTQSILAGAESQFMVYLARHSGVPVISPEPDRIWEASKLAKEFGRDSVVFFYFVRQLGYWNRFTEQPDIEVEAANMMKLMQETYQWKDIDFSVESMKVMHEATFGKPLDMHDKKWLYDITTPTPQDYATNVLARRSGELRDGYILEQIQDYWRQGYSPFAVFGAAHAIRLEPALRALSQE